MSIARTLAQALICLSFGLSSATVFAAVESKQVDQAKTEKAREELREKAARFRQEVRDVVRSRVQLGLDISKNADPKKIEEERKRLVKERKDVVEARSELRKTRRELARQGLLPFQSGENQNRRQL